MEQTPSSPTLINHALKFGAILGAIAAGITLLLYVVDISLMADWKVGLFLIAIFIGLVIYAGINYRNSIGGFLPYGKAFQHGYITLVVSGLVSTLFTILLYHVIDPSIPETLTEVTLEKTEEMLKGFGMSGDALDEALAKAAEDTPGRFSVTGQLTTFGWTLLANAVISAITSIFVKKNQPELV